MAEETPVELVTGALGTPHIDGDDWGALNKGILGPDCYVLKESATALACTMQDANKAVVPAFEASMYGRHARVKSPQTVTIQSGTQGQKRNDLIVLRYTRAADGTEKATLEPIKGTPTTGTAADPTTNPGPITSGASALTVDMPLWRIPLDGITVGTPVPLFNVMAPMSELWDSVNQMPRIYTGSTVLKFSNTNRARMWTVSEFETTFGVPFTDYQHYFVGIMNGDSNSTQNSATVSIGSTSGVEAISQSSLNGSFRFTWMVVVH